MGKVTLETLYGALKTYELELFQKRAIQSRNKGKMLNTSNALVAQEPKILVVSDQPRKRTHVGDCMKKRQLVWNLKMKKMMNFTLLRK